MAFTEASDKNRDVPDAADTNKDVETTKNKMGQPEQTITKNGDKKQVLNELDPEEGDEEEIMDDFDLTATRFLGGRRGKYQASGLSQLGDENLPDSHNESRGSSMTRQIDETVQDQSGVSGDFMEKMGGKTDRLGASQKNTGSAYEKHSESSSGSPDDGIQTAMGKDNLIGASQKNTGGSPEEFADSGTADAKDGIQDAFGNMGSDLGQNDKQKNKGGQHEPLKGSKNKMSEDWSIGGVAGIMEEDDLNIQNLFNNYAREANPVTLEEFQILAQAHGCEAPINEDTLEALMSANQECIFYESEDDAGRFWMAGPITEAGKPFPGAAPPFGSKDSDGGSDGGGNDDSESDGDSGDFGGSDSKCKTCSCDPCTCEGTQRGQAIKERRFGGAEETTFDPFQVDLNRAMQDPSYADEYPEVEPEVGPPVDLGMDDELSMDDDYFDDEPGLGAEGPGLGAEEPGLDLRGRGGLDDEELGPGRIGGRPKRRPPRGLPAINTTRPRPNPSFRDDSLGRLEGKSQDNQTLNEMTGTSGIAAPPMATSMSRGATVKRTEPKPEDDEPDDATTLKVVEGFTQCRRCGGIVDAQGCPTCALMRETHELGVEAPDPSTDKGGHFTTDATKSGQGDINGGIQDALTSESGSTKPDDGITTEISGMGSDLGQNEKQKNKGGQHEPLEGGGSGMQENIARMIKVAKRVIREGALAIRKNGNYGVSLIVHCEGIKPRRCRTLTEALVNVEELIQAYGPKTVQLEAHFFNGNRKILAKKLIPIPELAVRGPVVCEGRCIFRYAEVANDFADQIVAEGTKCRISRHNWGASVAGQYNWNAAQRAFTNIPLLQESMGRPT